MPPQKPGMLTVIPPGARSAVADAVSAMNPGARAIDAFVATKLNERGLHRSPEADRAALLRRVSLDLTGLPPTADDVAAYLRDCTPGAYQKRVEQLLASEHFGERMALVWLDAARYADTNGFSID